MDDSITTIKVFFKDLFIKYSTPRDIKTVRDYRYVKKWVKKVSARYVVFAALSLFETPIVFLLIPFFDIPQTLGYIIIPPCLFLTNWGYATLITYFPDIVRSIFKAGKTGFEAGEKIETTHIQVTHEYGNNYRVSSTTDNKGCLFGFLAGMIQFIIWAFFCVYIGPFLTLKKSQRAENNFININFSRLSPYISCCCFQGAHLRSFLGVCIGMRAVPIEIFIIKADGELQKFSVRLLSVGNVFN